MMKDKRRPQGAVFCLSEVSIQHSVLTCRHLPDDSRCRCSFYDPSSERLGILGFQTECQCRNHFEVISLDDVPVPAASATANALFVQNSAFENCPDIGSDGRYKYAEQIGDLALRKPYSVGDGTNRYLPVLDRYGLGCHIHLILYRFFI